MKFLGGRGRNQMFDPKSTLCNQFALDFHFITLSFSLYTHACAHTHRHTHPPTHTLKKYKVFQKCQKETFQHDCNAFGFTPFHPSPNRELLKSELSAGTRQFRQRWHLPMEKHSARSFLSNSIQGRDPVSAVCPQPRVLRATQTHRIRL